MIAGVRLSFSKRKKGRLFSQPPAGHVPALQAPRSCRRLQNAPQTKIETPPQGWRRAGDAIAGGGKLSK